MSRGDLSDLLGELTARFNAAVLGSVILGGRSGGSPGEALERLMSDSSFRDSCGVNIWDGVVWFGDQEWTRSIRAAVLAAGMVPTGRLNSLRTVRRFRKSMRTWRRAADGSGFRLEELLERSR